MKRVEAESDEKPTCSACGSKEITFQYKRAMDHHPLDERKALTEATDYLAEYMSMIGEDVAKVMCVADTLSDIAAMAMTREESES